MATTSSTSLNNASQILSSLGAGSGIDIASLVNSLVNAQYATKTQTLNDRASKLDTQISEIGALKSGLTDFANGLKDLVSGGTLTTQPTSARTDIVKVSAIGGKSASGLSASVEVRQLAQAQAAATAPVADATASVGTGSLTLTFGTATYDGSTGAITSFAAGSGAPVSIAIDSAHSSLNDIAAAINAANAGVTATVLTDSGGARLSIKGKTGADQAFTLTATEDVGAPGLSALEIGPGATGTTVGSGARDAIVAVDGLALKRSTNSISDLIPNVKLDLVSAAPGTSVALGSSAPTDTLTQAVNNFVQTYNNLHSVLKSDLDAKSGLLFGDPATATLNRSLQSFTLTKLASSATTGAPTTLAEIGVATNRDGTLTVNATQLSKAIATYPDAVEALFANGSGATEGGIAAAFQSIVDAATSNQSGLGASLARYTNARSDISDELDTLQRQQDATTTRLTQQFSTADSRISAYKQTQSFLTQQVAAWNASKN